MGTKIRQVNSVNWAYNDVSSVWKAKAEAEKKKREDWEKGKTVTVIKDPAHPRLVRLKYN